MVIEREGGERVAERRKVRGRGREKRRGGERVGERRRVRGRKEERRMLLE